MFARTDRHISSYPVARARWVFALDGRHNALSFAGPMDPTEVRTYPTGEYTHVCREGERHGKRLSSLLSKRRLREAYRAHRTAASKHMRISASPQARRGDYVGFPGQQVVFLGKGGKQTARGLGFNFTA